MKGLITKEDREFRFSILNREPLPFDYKLTKVENLIKKIRLKEFEYKEVLNCSLVDFLFPKKEVYIAQYQILIKQIYGKSKSAVAFINCYIEKGQAIDSFIEILCKEWNSFWDFIVLESGYSTDRKDIYLKLIVEHVDIETIKQLDENLNITNYLSDKVDFLDVFTDEPNIRKIIKTLNIKFKSLLPSKKENHLFDFIYKSDLYEVNLSMIEFIIKAYSSENLATLKTANYTMIQMSKCENLINYIDKNLNQYISTVFLAIPENIDEAENTVIDLLNKESVTLEQKKGHNRKTKLYN
jgi:hypothetical protein